MTIVHDPNKPRLLVYEDREGRIRYNPRVGEYMQSRGISFWQLQTLEDVFPPKLYKTKLFATRAANREVRRREKVLLESPQPNYRKTGRVMYL